MERIYIFLIFLFIAATDASPPRISKIYRSDYEYNRKADAFYKFHIEILPLVHAKEKCEAEGAKLLIAATDTDLEQVHGMFKRYPDIGSYAFVDYDGQTHQSAEEEALIKFEEHSESGDDYDYSRETETPNTKECEVVTRDGKLESGSVCYHRLPFFCKVDANYAPYDELCDVYGNGYEYVPSVGSCYKIPRIVYKWDEAYAECQAEGAHLVVLNSEAEHLAVKGIMQKTRLLPKAYSPYYYIAGFRANETIHGIDHASLFRTIFNQTLQEAGYAEWADTEPNNFAGKEYCGSLYEGDGKLNDHNCKNPYGFICEKEKHQ